MKFSLYIQYNPKNKNVHVDNSNLDRSPVIDNTPEKWGQKIKVWWVHLHVSIIAVMKHLCINGRFLNISVIGTTTHPKEKQKKVYETIQDIVQKPLDITRSINLQMKLRMF
ncbi:MAG: hypothetical protein M3162_05560 [Thermoproteota archaeon]|nr:hypothetical protein [Thermoproteota archaeon]